jgi:TfoX/Sxy family transcriptional regulator of competence genes
MRFRVEMEITDTDKNRWDDPPQMADYIKEALEKKENIHVTRLVTEPIT